jgi:hypothetical protein
MTGPMSHDIIRLTLQGREPTEQDLAWIAAGVKDGDVVTLPNPRRKWWTFWRPRTVDLPWRDPRISMRERLVRNLIKNNVLLERLQRPSG